MNDRLIAMIDLEISHLQQARAALSREAPKKPSRGRPKGSAGKPVAVKKRVLSAEAKARIAAAQKKRWAAAKKAAA